MWICDDMCVGDLKSAEISIIIITMIIIIITKQETLEAHKAVECCPYSLTA